MPRPPSRKTGARAQLLEVTVEGLHLIDFQIYESYGSYEAAEIRRSRYVIRNYPHPSLYGTPGRKEALIVADDEQYILECKYQDSSGSVDEKLPYLWMAFLVSPVPGWLIVFEGNYWNRDSRGLRAKTWLKHQQPPEGREFHVFTRKEFNQWARGKWGNGLPLGGQQWRRQQETQRREREGHAPDAYAESLWGD